MRGDFDEDELDDEDDWDPSLEMDDESCVDCGRSGSMCEECGVCGALMCSACFEMGCGVCKGPHK